MKIEIILENENGTFSQIISKPYEFDIDLRTHTLFTKHTDLYDKDVELNRGFLEHFHKIVSIKGFEHDNDRGMLERIFKEKTEEIKTLKKEV